MTAVAQRSFAGGEIAPELYGRVDQLKYQTGLRRCRNFMVQRHGGVANRPGMQFVAPSRNQILPGKLIKFVFTEEQSYLIHLTNDQRASFYRNGAPVPLPALSAWDDDITYGPGDFVTHSGFVRYSLQGPNLNQDPDLTGGTYWVNVGTPDGLVIPSPYGAELGLGGGIQYAQNGDIITLAHPSYPPYELRRFLDSSGNVTFQFVAVSLSPGIPPPQNLTGPSPGSGPNNYFYRVTAIAAETFEESLPSNVRSALLADEPTPADPISLSWDAVTGAQEYDVYKRLNGRYGYIGTAGSNSFDDEGYIPNTAIAPPVNRTLFDSPGNYPSTVTYFQQRLAFASSNNQPATVWASRIGRYKNFTKSSPIQDDDSIDFTVVGREAQIIRHLIEVGKLVMLTSSGEWTVEGGADGVLRPSAINPRQQGYDGSAAMRPIVIGNNVLFVQARNFIVRDLRYDWETDGYFGRDLTIFSPHLFEGFRVVAWDFQRIPHSIVWAVRDDGQLIALTYLKEHEVWGWHRHDTDGHVFDLCTLPEGEEDAVYMLVRRHIDGSDRYYIERLSSRRVARIEEATFMDSFLSYNGYRNGNVGVLPGGVTLTGGTDWTAEEDLRVTLSFIAPYTFSPDDVGNAVILHQGDELLRCEIIAVVSEYQIDVRAEHVVPVSFRGATFQDWYKAVDRVAGLDHLEGKSVSILADGNVISNGIDEPLYTVEDGQIQLDQPYAIIHVGLPYQSDFETLDLEVAQGESLVNKNKLVKQVSLLVKESRGIHAGSDEDHLWEFKQRAEEAYGEATGLLTGPAEIPISSTWNNNGRIFVRQRDPLPLTILAAIPNVTVGG